MDRTYRTTASGRGYATAIACKRASFLIFAKTDSGMAHLTMSGVVINETKSHSANMESLWNIRQNGEG